MSDEFNNFDQVFRDRLSGQTATPPPAVWENIQATRTFGHVVANRISTNWRIFGTLLMLILAGGSSMVLFGEEETKRYHTIQYSNSQNELFTNEINNQPIIKTDNNLINHHNNAINHQSISQTKASKLDNNFTERNFYPSPDLIASVHQAGFNVPILENQRLTAYIEQLDGWGSALPKGFTRFEHLDEMAAQGIDFNEMNAAPKRVFIDWDYVIPQVERKSFMERSSLVINLTPHTIHKSMRAEYNLSSSFLEDRKKAESTRLAYTVGLLWQYEVKRHRFIETGINYTQIYEEMLYEGKKRFSNQYNFVEIPLLLGFENRNSKWGWHIKGGFGLQIYNSYKGYILKRVDEFGGEESGPLLRKSAVKNFIQQDHRLTNNQAKNEVANLEDEGENPFKTAGVVNFHLASGLTYYHSIRTSFMLSPSYKQSLNSITKESALFSEKLSYTGISFSARVKF